MCRSRQRAGFDINEQPSLLDWSDDVAFYRGLKVEHKTVRIAGRAFQVAALKDAADLLDGDALIKSMPDVAVSASSACTSATLQPSFVLSAMGATDAEVHGSVRFSIGRFTTAEEVAHVANRVIESVTAQRQAARQTSANPCGS